MGLRIRVNLTQAIVPRLAADCFLELMHSQVDMRCNMSGRVGVIEQPDGKLQMLESRSPVRRDSILMYHCAPHGQSRAF